MILCYVVCVRNRCTYTLIKSNHRKRTEFYVFVIYLIFLFHLVDGFKCSIEKDTKIQP